MKKTVTFLLMCMMGLFALNTETANAQHEKGDIVISAGAGYGLFNSLLSSAELDSEDYSVFATPPLIATVDFGVSDLLSIGVMINYGAFGSRDKYQYFNSTNELVEEEVKERFSCLGVNVRPLFHYGNVQNMDFYSGLGLGIGFLNSSNNSTDPDYTFFTTGFSGTAICLQITTGMRYYFTDNIGLHVEFSPIGPYVFEGGLSIKL